MNRSFLHLADINLSSVLIPQSVMYVFAGIVVVAAIVLFFMQQTKKLKNQVEDLQKKRNETKELLDNAEQMNKQLVQGSLVEKEQNELLIAKMSYEIHNCVNGIMGMTTLLKDTELSREQIRTTNIIISCSKKLLEAAHESFNNEVSTIKSNRNGKFEEKQKVSKEFAQKYPLSILIAEDDEINQQLALKLLNKIGYLPDIASNGKEALEMVSEKNYDLILMDVLMPEMDGFEATKMIRLCLDIQPVIVAVTASAMAGDKDKCLQAGMDDYICKPIVIDELMPLFIKWAEDRKLVYKV